MLKRSSSSLRLWTHAHTKGGSVFCQRYNRDRLLLRVVVLFSRKREKSKGKKEMHPITEREREMIRLNPTTTTTRKSLSPSFSLRVECLSQNTQDSTHYWAHARAQKKNRSSLSSFLARCCFFWRHKVEHSSTSKGSTKNAL